MTTEQIQSWYQDMAQLIKQERQRRGLTQQELARIAGISQGRLSLIEHGHVEATIPTFLVLFDVLRLGFVAVPYDDEEPATVPPAS